MINYVCAKTVPDSTKLHLMKDPKSKFPRGSMPPDPPSLPHALHIDTYLPPLGQKTERNTVEYPLVSEERDSKQQLFIT